MPLNIIATGSKVIKKKGNKQEIDRLVSEGWWIWRHQKSKVDGYIYITLLPAQEPI